MTMDRVLRLTSGVVLMIVFFFGILPAKEVHWFWKAFIVFMSINQIQSAFTNWCPVMTLYRVLGVRECKC